MKTDLNTLCILPDSPLRDAVRRMDQNRLGILLVVDRRRHLTGTVTDGDVRRAILAGFSLKGSLQALLKRKEGTVFARPITAFSDAGRDEILDLLQKHAVSHVPLVDHEGRVKGLASLGDFIPDHALPVQAIIMAGGAGSRLHPLTEDTPKPMLEVGGKPLLEIIVQQLREAGIQKVRITTHHHAQKIEDHFGDGHHFGVGLSFSTEDEPLGTVGGLRLMEAPKETTLVMNGDILTQVNFRAMLAFHKEHQAELTVAVRQHQTQVPYGVVECDGPRVVGLEEKPVRRCFINAGIYLLEPPVYELIPRRARFDMTDLIQRLLEGERTVASFPIRENWMDIGRHSDYADAQEHVKNWGLDR